MLRNYLTVALRNLRREFGYTIVNVVGLAVGVACSLLIIQFIRHEWSYDRFHEKSDRIYRAWGREDWGEGREFFYTVTPLPLAEALEANIPEVEETVRIRAFEALVGPKHNVFHESLRMVDTTFFSVFDFSFDEGHPNAAFPSPNSVVITPGIAHKYFGEASPIGRTLTIDIVDQPQDYTVTGVIDEAPSASSIQFDLLIPFSKAPDLIGPGAFTNWFSVSVETYALLTDAAAPSAVEAKLPAMMDQILGDEAARSGYELGLQPVTDIHLNKAYPVGIEPTSDPVYSYFLAGIAVLVLVVACINFVTLSIGQSARRSGEVGIRKAMGAGRYQLMRQFWGEALLVVAFSLCAGLALAWLALPFFNDLAGQELSLQLNLALLIVLAFMGLLVAGLAGVYPALVLSGLRPMEVFRGKVSIGGDRSPLRRGLVVTQFAISIFMIVAALFVVRQLDYLREKDLGYQKDHIVVLRTGRDGPDADRILDRLRESLQGHPAVRSMASSAFPMDEGWARFGFDTDDGRYAEIMANVVSPEFLETMEIPVEAGRGFSRERTADSTAMLVNESFLRTFGFEDPAAALGRRLPASSFPDHEIVGVVPDFNYESLHSDVRPLALVRSGDWLFIGSNDVNVPSSMRLDLSIRIAPDDVAATVDLLKRTWGEVAGDLPFEFYFLDEAVDNYYRQERQLGRIVGTASALAIVIACVGLFGLASLAVVRRTKEIGVRKVLGATVPSIILLLVRDLAMLVGIAFAVSVPVAFVLVNRWLENFAYQVEVGAATFVAAGLIALFLALATVSYHSTRAATTDPVKSLRYE